MSLTLCEKVLPGERLIEHDDPQCSLIIVEKGKLAFFADGNDGRRGAGRQILSIGALEGAGEIGFLLNGEMERMGGRDGEGVGGRERRKERARLREGGGAIIEETAATGGVYEMGGGGVCDMGSLIAVEKSSVMYVQGEP